MRILHTQGDIDSEDSDYAISDTENKDSQNVDKASNESYFEDSFEGSEGSECSECVEYNGICPDCAEPEKYSNIDDERINKFYSNEIENMNIDDSENKDEVLSNPVSLEEFLEKSKTAVMPENPACINEVRELFMPDELFDFMAERTNRAHAKKQNANPEARDDKWKDVTGTDLKKMLGLIILMSYYWKDDLDMFFPDYSRKVPEFGTILSQDRFWEI